MYIEYLRKNEKSSKIYSQIMKAGDQVRDLDIDDMIILK